MNPTACSYGYRIVGACDGERRLVDAAAAFAAYCRCDDRARVDSEAYLSAFTYPQAFADWLGQTGSTKGYTGPCWASWLWLDIDASGNLPAALEAGKRLAVGILERYRLADDDLLLFFSGSKGFHVGLPTSLWQPEPSADFHRIARQLAEGLAAVVGITTDVGVYDKVRAFRAPNSRHPKTGLHKRRLTVDEMLHLSVAAILKMATEPLPFDLPAPAGRNDTAAADWQQATERCRQQAEAKAQRQTATDGTATLNRATLDFIRDGATEGDRGRLLFSAAANLAEFHCPPALVHAILTDTALDSGLSPAEVRRQIECGLSHENGGAA